MEEKKTHRLIEKPTMSVRFLADYMAASDQARRTILRGCKFRTIARLVQHDDAKLAVAKFMLGGTNDPEVLVAEADYIRNKLADSDFDRDCNDINADYVAQFAKVVADIEPLPAGAEWRPVKPPFASQSVNGVRVTFGPALLTRRLRHSVHSCAVDAVMSFCLHKTRRVAPEEGETRETPPKFPEFARSPALPQLSPDRQANGSPLRNRSCCSASGRTSTAS